MSLPKPVDDPPRTTLLSYQITSFAEIGAAAGGEPEPDSRKVQAETPLGSDRGGRGAAPVNGSDQPLTT